MNECERPLEQVVEELHEELNRYKDKVADLKESINNYIDIFESRFERERVKLWIDVCVATASASNSLHHESMVTWADYALQAFDERFKPQSNE